MKLLLTRILPLVAVLLVSALLGLGPRAVPEPLTPTPKPRQAKKSTPGRVAAIASKGHTGGIPRPDRSAEPSLPDAPAEPSPAETMVVVSEPKGPNWSSLLQRHAEGDKAALPDFLRTLTAENALAAWSAVRTAKLSPNDRGNLFETLGKIGGGSLVKQLIDGSDPHAARAVKGWGQADPDGAFDWFRQLDVRDDQRLREYLRASHQVPEGFLDKAAAGLLDALHPAPDPAAAESTREAYSAATLRLVESLMEQQPRQAEAMMRELTGRLLRLYEGNTLADWVTTIENPVIRSSAIQRIIEADTFRHAPLEAVDWAFSLEDPKSRQNAISAAFGKLGSGSGGIDPAAITGQLNAMPADRDRDFAINGFAHGLVGAAPQDALAWAAAISDDKFRATVTENLSRRIEAQTKKKP